MLEVKRVQRAVGQGGFHTGQVEFGGEVFRYVFDCGSMQAAARERELRSFAEELGDAPLDLLVLSHLDTDHVNGVEMLLASRNANAVLIPYLHPFERLALIAEACVEGSLTEAHLDLLADPVRWFQQRGTGRVIQVLPSGPDTPPVDGPAVLDGPPPQLRNEKTARFLLHGSHPPDERERTMYPGLGKHGEPEVLSPGGALGLAVGMTQSVVWMFVPYTHPELERLVEFVKRACKVLGVRPSGLRMPGSFFARVQNVLRDKTLRSELAKTYGALRADRNLSSMSMYAGPAWSIGTTRVHYEARHGDEFLGGPWHWSTRIGHARLGWLSTGDAVLTSGTRAAAFGRFYSQLFPHVVTFVIPHHGSKHNFKGSLFATALQSVIWVAAHGRNHHGHPHMPLLHALSRQGVAVQVQTRRSSELLEEAFIG